MTKEELKPQVEDMIYHILKLVQQLDSKESYELKIELACTVIKSAIDFKMDNPTQTLINLHIALTEVTNTALNGVYEVILNKRSYKKL